MTSSEIKRCDKCKWFGQGIVNKKDLYCCCAESKFYLKGITLTQEACDKFEKDE